MNTKEINELLSTLSAVTESLESLYTENEGECTEQTEKMEVEIDTIKELLTTEGIDSLGRWLKSKEDEKKSLKAEKDYISRRMQAVDKTIDYIKSMVNIVMRDTGTDKIKGEHGYCFQTYTSDTTDVDKTNLRTIYEQKILQAMVEAHIPAYVTVTLNASPSIAREVGVIEGDEVIFNRHVTPTVKFTKPRASKEA